MDKLQDLPEVQAGSKESQQGAASLLMRAPGPKNGRLFSSVRAISLTRTVKPDVLQNCNADIALAFRR